MIKDIGVGFLVFVVAPWAIGSFCPWERGEREHASRWLSGFLIMAVAAIVLFILLYGGRVAQMALSEYLAR